MAHNFDVIVIGAGPGGYIAAIRAAQLGFATACIDEWKNEQGGPAPGGTCTNVGCIPSKALLQSSEYYEHAGHQFKDHGIFYLFKKNKISFFHGRGSFVGKGDAGYEIAVAGASAETLVAKHVIVATGSNARALPGAPFDEQQVLSND